MATSIDDNAADEKSGKSYGWLLIIRCTRCRQAEKPCQKCNRGVSRGCVGGTGPLLEKCSRTYNKKQLKRWFQDVTLHLEASFSFAPYGVSNTYLLSEGIHAFRKIPQIRQESPKIKEGQQGTTGTKSVPGTP